MQEIGLKLDINDRSARINYAKLREFLCIYCNRKSDEAIQIRVKSITTIGIS